MLNSTCRTILVCKLSHTVNFDGLTLLTAFVLMILYIWNSSHALRRRDEIQRSSQLRTLLKRVAEKRSWKKFRRIRDLNPWPLRYRCSALPTELTSQLGAAQFVGSKLEGLFGPNIFTCFVESPRYAVILLRSWMVTSHSGFLRD